jgi:hypothetical protein
MSTLQLEKIDVSPAKSQKNKNKKKKKERKKASGEKFDQTLSSRRKMRRTLPLGNSQNKKRKFKPCHQEEHTDFGSG